MVAADQPLHDRCCWSESRPFGRRAALLAGLCLALPAAAPAQQPARPAQAQGSDKADALQKRDEELKALREQQQKSTEAEAEIKRQIEEIGNDRRKLNQALIDSAAKLREVETKVSDTETRLKPLDAQRTRIFGPQDGDGAASSGKCWRRSSASAGVRRRR